jgi:hypothetical protein
MRFEAAGQIGSFTAAARELSVTQTTVSRLVRLLEDLLGYPWFRRHANALELTAQEQALQFGLTKLLIPSPDSLKALRQCKAAGVGG